jgi:predicted RNA-binding Zn-ribbon protein involved in translation (DUF1610 family)
VEAPVLNIYLFSAATYRAKIPPRNMKRMPMLCPSCRRIIPFDKGIFRGFRCPGCHKMMFVSALYGRTLSLLCFFAAEVILWFWQLFYPRLGVPFGFLASLWLGFPLAFVLLFFAVRTVPRIIVPTLVVRNFGTVTTLELTQNG